MMDKRLQDRALDFSIIDGAFSAVMGSLAGQIKIIDLVVAKIAVRDGEIIIPNSELARRVIKRVERMPK